MQMELQTIPSIKDRIIALPGRPSAIIDFHLAEIYGTITKYLNQQIGRNRDWFTEKYRFRLERNEVAILNLKTGKNRRGHPPWAYTHEGCNLAAFVLNTPQAKSQRELIIEAFTALERGEMVPASISDAQIQRLTAEAAAYRVFKKMLHSKQMNLKKIKKWERYIQMPLRQTERAKLLEVPRRRLGEYEEDLRLGVKAVVPLLEAAKTKGKEK